MDEGPLKSGGVDNVELAESEVGEVQNIGDVQWALAGVQSAVAFDVSGHTVDDVGDGLAGVGVVGVVVDDRGKIDSAVGTKREETLIPVDVSIEKGELGLV